MRGRKPVPSKVIDIKGGSKFTHRPPRSGEPKPPAIIPKCPNHLDKEARHEWKRTAKELAPLGLLTTIDKAVFAAYCDAYSIWSFASKKVQEDGMVIISPNGFPIINPHLSISSRAKDQMLRALVEIGMSPSIRSCVKVSEQPKEESRRERFFK